MGGYHIPVHTGFEDRRRLPYIKYFLTGHLEIKTRFSSATAILLTPLFAITTVYLGERKENKLNNNMHTFTVSVEITFLYNDLFAHIHSLQ
jgi:hypothetical protein